ncbi:hypothetical protein ACIRQP_38360 [Streptomyces sp. NPDC102274]|uniref:hypothetical protein n=1 Tax=Streptomyces sp. NPDC102274 TaxID=3366151 RepID=UPI0037F2F9FE
MVAAQADGPYFFVAEAVLPFLHQTDVRHVVGLLADRFPGSLPALASETEQALPMAVNLRWTGLPRPHRLAG